MSKQSIEEAGRFATEVRRHNQNRPQNSLVYDPVRCRMVPMPKPQAELQSRQGNVLVVDNMAREPWA